MMTKDTNVTEMTNMMVGHAVTLNIERPDPVDPRPRIEVEGLTIRNEDGILKLKDVSFTANSGEILGIAGISGCGQKELLEAIAGLQVTESGRISYVEEDGTKEELIGMDPKTNKLKLSRKVLLPKPEGYVERERRPRGERPERGERHERHGRPERKEE